MGSLAAKSERKELCLHVFRDSRLESKRPFQHAPGDHIGLHQIAFEIGGANTQNDGKKKYSAVGLSTLLSTQSL